MKKEYKLYVDTAKHGDIYEYLERLKKPARSEMIRAAIRLAIFNQNRTAIQKAEQEKVLPDPPSLLRKRRQFG